MGSIPAGDTSRALPIGSRGEAAVFVGWEFKGDGICLPAWKCSKNGAAFGPSQLAMRHFVFLIAIFVSLIPDLRAAEPFFKPNDVVALVGGEDMVVAAELGYLETLIQLALPDHHLKFRSLAREGDTVFEQRRDLNYPKLEDQLDKMGATVVICQFGQMESLAAGAAESTVAKDKRDKSDEKDTGKAGVPLVPSVPLVPLVPLVPEKADATRKAKVAEFVAAYEKLIARLSGGGKRRVALVEPVFITDAANDYLTATRSIAERHSLKVVESFVNHDVPDSDGVKPLKQPVPNLALKEIWKQDRVHLSEAGHLQMAQHILFTLDRVIDLAMTDWADGNPPHFQKATTLITAKNRLWFHYYRPQNWAFLAGDRTNQPSSRDHLDPSKRWFPEELEKFVPLIDAKDAEIWALAKKLK